MCFSREGIPQCGASETEGTLAKVGSWKGNLKSSGSGMSGAVVVNGVGLGEELLKVRGMDAMDSFVDMLGQVQLTPQGESCQTEFFSGLCS